MSVDACEQPEARSNLDLLDELRALVEDRPRWRLHVNPESAVWIMIGVRNIDLSPYVQVVADPSCPDLGKGWIETVTTQQWRALRALVGQRVTVDSAVLGRLTGVLLSLTDGEARLDLGAGDVRYLPWLAIRLATGSAVPRG